MFERPDEELVARWAAGDLSAFEALYDRYRQPLYRYLLRLAGDEASANDWYQGAWEKVIRARKSYKPKAPFRAWLYRIAHNHVIDVRRRERRMEHMDTDAVVKLPGKDPPMDIAQLLRDCVQRLLALLSGLPETQRSAFLLKEEAGLSLAQIGEVTGVERETVKSRLRYALRRLRAGLEGCDE